MIFKNGNICNNNSNHKINDYYYLGSHLVSSFGDKYYPIIWGK
jgi:hypothetical protein